MSEIVAAVGVGGGVGWISELIISAILKPYTFEGRIKWATIVYAVIKEDTLFLSDSIDDKKLIFNISKRWNSDWYLSSASSWMISLKKEAEKSIVHLDKIMAEVGSSHEFYQVSESLKTSLSSAIKIIDNMVFTIRQLPDYNFHSKMYHDKINNYTATNTIILHQF